MSAQLSNDEMCQHIFGVSRAPKLTVIGGTAPRTALDHALAYAKRGFFVLPIRPGEKEPFAAHNTKDPAKATPGHPLNGGVRIATRDAVKIRKWFAEFPAINWGVRLDGMTAVDVDTNKGDHWRDELAVFSGFLELPQTLGHRSASGGFHALYKGLSPNSHYQSRDNVRSVIDIISGPGRYVVGPGSVVDGRMYQLVDAPVVDLPTDIDIKREREPVERTSVINEKPADEEQVREALKFIRKDDIDTRAVWLNFGFALLYEFGPELGRELWDEVSARGDKFDADDQNRTWESLQKDKLPSKIVTAATIFHYARKGGFGSADHEFGDVAALTAEVRRSEALSLVETDDDVTEADIVGNDASALVRGLLYPGNSAMIYAESGEGKSFIAADLAFAIAQGRDWHGMKVQQAPVLFVALEGVAGFRKRMRALNLRFGSSGGMFNRLRVHVSLASGKDGEAGLAQILATAKAIAELRGAPVGLIVIDTMARATAGDDENAVKDAMAYLERRVGEIARQTGAAVLTVHHENKSGAARGSSAFKAGFDVVLHAANGTLTVEKAKDDAGAPLFKYALDEIQVATRPDGTPIMSCTLATSPAEQTNSRSKRAKSKPMAKGERFFRAAFAAAEQNGRASVAAVRAEFLRLYPTGESDGEAAIEARQRAFRRAVGDLPDDFKVETAADGAETIVLSSDPLDLFEAGADNG